MPLHFVFARNLKNDDFDFFDEISNRDETWLPALMPSVTVMMNRKLDFQKVELGLKTVSDA